MNDIEKKELLDLLSQAVAVGINATGLGAEVRALKMRVDEHGNMLAEHEKKISAHEIILYGDPRVVDKPGLVGIVLQVSNSISRQQSLGWKIVEFLVLMGVGGLLTLLAMHSITP